MTALTFFTLCRLQSNSLIFFPLIPQVRPRGVHNPCQTISGHLQRKEQSSDVGGGLLKIQKPVLSNRQHRVSQHPRIVLVDFKVSEYSKHAFVRVIPISLGHIQMCGVLHIAHFKGKNTVINFSMKIMAQNQCIST